MTDEPGETSLSELPRALGRPNGLPLYAWVTQEGSVRAVQTFEDPSRNPGVEAQADGSRCLPVFGDEPPIDLNRQYFEDAYAIEGDRVIRTRTVRDLARRAGDAERSGDSP